MNLNNIITCLFIGVLKTSVLAQEAVPTDSLVVQDLDEVVVTATRTVRQLSSVPLPVTLISKQQLQRTGVVRLNEILNEQTGMITVADESGFSGVQIQGIASDYVMILIDGVPLVGRTAGNFDLSRLTVGNIRQIEIVKGPSSSLYGSEALGGVINIITEKPQNAVVKGDISYRFASFNTHDANISIKQKNNKLGYSFFANTLQSDGYDLRPEVVGQTVDPYQNYTFNGQLHYDFSKRLRWFSSGRYYMQMQAGTFQANDALLVSDNTINEANAHIRLNHKPNTKWNFQYEWYYTNYKASEIVNNVAIAALFSENAYNQHLLKPEIRGTYVLKPQHTLTLGVGYTHERLDRTFFDSKVVFNAQYAYAQYDFYPWKKMNLILGARFDNHTAYQSQFSPKFSMNYKLTDALSLKGSMGYGFKAPDFRQLYFDFTNSAVGYTVLGYNVAVAKVQELQKQGQVERFLFDLAELEKPLEAESSIGYNIGAAYSQGKLKMNLNLFRNDFKNLIDTRAIARKTNGQNVFSYTNFNRIYTTGLELDLRYKLSEKVTFSTGYQLLYAKDKEKQQALERGEVFARDAQTLQTVALDNSGYFGLVNRSRHIANFKFFYIIPKWKSTINFRVNYRSKYALFDANGNGIIDDYDNSFVDGYALGNLTLNKTFSDKYILQLGVNNLFDYKDTQNIPALAGIQLFTKINIQF